MRPSNLMLMLVGCFLFAIVSPRFSTTRIETHSLSQQTQVLATPAPLPGYRIIDATLTIPNTGDSPPVKLNATIKQVDSVLARDYPHLFKRDAVTKASSLHTRDVTEDPKPVVSSFHQEELLRSGSSHTRCNHLRTRLTRQNSNIAKCRRWSSRLFPYEL